MKLKHRVITAACVLSIVGGAVYAAVSLRAANPPSSAREQTRVVVVTAPGSVEPVSEEIAVGSELTAKLDSVLIEEGSVVKAGQTIAVIVNADFAAQVASARATLQ